METNNYIQWLIENKNFNELSNEEKTQVLLELTEEEYNSRRMVIENMRVFLHEGVSFVMPNENIKTRVMTVMKMKRQQQTSVVMRIFSYKLPFYIPVAAAVFLFFALRFTFQQETGKTYLADAKDTITRVMYKTDTVVLEKEIIKKIPVTTIKYVSSGSQSASQVSIVNQGRDRVVNTSREVILENMRLLLEKQNQTSGRSMGDMNDFSPLNGVQDTATFNL